MFDIKKLSHPCLINRLQTVPYVDFLLFCLQDAITYFKVVDVYLTMLASDAVAKSKLRTALIETYKYVVESSLKEYASKLLGIAWSSIEVSMKYR